MLTKRLTVFSLYEPTGQTLKLIGKLHVRTDEKKKKTISVCVYHRRVLFGPRYVIRLPHIRQQEQQLFKQTYSRVMIL
jgi:hypothetical protein